MLHRIKFKKIGSHVHCKLYTGYQPGNMGLNGELVFREEEFRQFRKSQYGICWFEEEGASTDGAFDALDNRHISEGDSD
jgi:hypothetical protein